MLNFDKKHLMSHIPQAINEGYLQRDGKRLIITRKGHQLALELERMRPRKVAVSRDEKLSTFLDHILRQMEVFANGS